jgi:hypothetical protein
LPIKFDGTKGSYFIWRNAAIQAIHRANSGVSTKIGALLNSFDKDKPQLKRFIPTAAWDHVAYRKLIKDLEETFGGDDNMINYHKSKLGLVPEVVMHDTEGLARLKHVVDTYANVLESARQLDKLNTPEIYNLMHVKLPQIYKHQYQEWHQQRYNNDDLDDHVVPQTTQSLVTWMNIKLKKMRTADVQRDAEEASLTISRMLEKKKSTKAFTTQVTSGDEADEAGT